MKKSIVIFFIISLIFTACSSLTLAPSDFAWPIETVLEIDENGDVKIDRYSFSFNTGELFLEEFEDSLGYRNKEIRIIGDRSGYYYITGEGFRHVYVFARGEAALVMETKILITEEGLQSPVMNQRSPYIELINKNFKYFLNKDGITKVE